MDAKEYLEIALGGNMNTATLKPLAIEDLMEAYLKQEARSLLSKVEDAHPDQSCGIVRDWCEGFGIQ